MTEMLARPNSKDKDSPETNDMPGGPMVGEQLNEAEVATLKEIQETLILEGEESLLGDYAWMRRQFGDEQILDGLAQVESRTGIPIEEFVRHTRRWSELDTSLVLHGHAAIPIDPDNTHSDGRERRHEEGSVIDLDLVRKQDIDPSRVLYYRVTQYSDTPKPEYYWTSDSLEVRTGLRKELGSQHQTAIILVSTLEEIAKNGGLILDINDDEGTAVRQIGLAPFEQKRALFVFSRVKGYEPQYDATDAEIHPDEITQPSIPTVEADSPDADVW